MPSGLNHYFKLLKITALAVLVAVGFSVIPACKTGSKSAKNTTKSGEPFFDFGELIPEEPPVYQASPRRIFNLIHTQLDIGFDWERAILDGEAIITCKPHFYPTDSLTLDAVCFDVKEVWQLEKGKEKRIDYSYDNKKIRIKFPKPYTRNDTVKVIVRYVAKPEECETGGSMAITSDKGLFFINPNGDDPYKPRQIWTQGETSYSSRWFPTIDVPNQRMKQDIKLTVDKKFATLSNGLLISSVFNQDGTRTDHWRQNLSHAPYLTMIAVGEFAVVKDKWRNMELTYYVEPAYEKYAKDIFGKTPEMMEFYSKLLKVDYPWEKYGQVVVRDYVSGAMENTSATVFGEYVQRTNRELLDSDAEDVIAHELFHHWFGDLVTCESWANLPLNESFATYGEYLWSEHKHGIDEAEYHRMQDLQNYLNESRTKMVSLFRPNYLQEEEMFDSHSYAKGGLILHLLRKTVGDDAFFEALHVYLVQNKFKSVEMANLRLAFEEVTGMDMNWFFDQWFNSAGHPELKPEYAYDEATRKLKITVQQQQGSISPVYQLPVQLEVYLTNEKKSYEFETRLISEEFEIDCPTKPLLVVLDPQRIIPGTVEQSFDVQQCATLYKRGQHFRSRLLAIEKLKDHPVTEESKAVLTSALNDPHYEIRIRAMKALMQYTVDAKSGLKEKLQQIARKDPKSAARAQALETVNALFPKAEWVRSLNVELLDDKSYTVISQALNSIFSYDEALAFEQGSKFQNDSNTTLLATLARIYAQSGSDKDHAFFERSFRHFQSYERITLMDYYSEYLINRSESLQLKGMAVFEKDAINNSNWLLRYMAKSQIQRLRRANQEKLSELEIKAERLKGEDKAANEKRMESLKRMDDAIKKSLEKINQQAKESPALEMFGE
jgi:aminopeptidase N